MWTRYFFWYFYFVFSTCRSHHTSRSFLPILNHHKSSRFWCLRSSDVLASIFLITVLYRDQKFNKRQRSKSSLLLLPVLDLERRSGTRESWEKSWMLRSFSMKMDGKDYKLKSQRWSLSPHPLLLKDLRLTPLLPELPASFLLKKERSLLLNYTISKRSTPALPTKYFTTSWAVL